jgi:hypothetical protein
VVRLTQAGEHLRVLDAHGIKSFGFEAQCLQDRGCDLGCGDRCLDGAPSESRMREDQAHVRVAETEAAVFLIYLKPARAGH